MKVTVHDWYTDIKLTAEEMKHLCAPGERANTCVWLVLGADGFKCTYFNKPPALMDRYDAGETVAKRDGCDFVKAIDPSKLGSGEHELQVPEIIE